MCLQKRDRKTEYYSFMMNHKPIISRETAWKAVSTKMNKELGDSFDKKSADGIDTSDMLTS